MPNNILWLFFTSILFIPLTSFIIKRLHDIGLSTWFGVIFFPAAFIMLYIHTPFFWSIIDGVLPGVIVFILSLVHITSVLFLLLKPGR